METWEYVSGNASLMEPNPGVLRPGNVLSALLYVLLTWESMLGNASLQSLKLVYIFFDGNLANCA